MDRAPSGRDVGKWFPGIVRWVFNTFSPNIAWGRAPPPARPKRTRAGRAWSDRAQAAEKPQGVHFAQAATNTGQGQRTGAVRGREGEGAFEGDPMALNQ